MMRWTIIVFLLLSIVSCTHKSEGDNAGQSPFAHVSNDANPLFDLPEIQQNVELIILTLYVPSSFFEFRGENFGVQYMIANEYAKSIGSAIRVDVSRIQHELVQKLMNGEGDLVAYNLDIADSLSSLIDYCGESSITAFLDSLSKVRHDESLRTSGHTAWAVRKESPLLRASLSEWMEAHSNDFYEYSTIRIRTSKGKVYTPRRKVASPAINLAAGQISRYDAIFKQYAMTCGWDWRLIAAQCYQESGFDPDAVSYMGAMGLMQLMPSTARQYGVSQSEVFDPTANVRGATKLISNLNSHYSSITNPDERINFILAAYNAGPGHVDDARTLAKKYGKNPNVWLGNVDEFVLKMADREYYNQPEVKHGYFRGSETYNYVNSIRTRWSNYRR